MSYTSLPTSGNIILGKDGLFTIHIKENKGVL